ncbi:hypothetical protein D9602_07115 [Sphingomonas sp. TX0522]|nr:hypothetical protein [Sphingomonas sp. TX0522]
MVFLPYGNTLSCPRGARSHPNKPSFPRRRESRLAGRAVPSPTSEVMDSRLRGNDGCGGGGQEPAPSFVIPANAGIHGGKRLMMRATPASSYPCIPASAGMTNGGQSEPASPLTPPA